MLGLWEGGGVGDSVVYGIDVWGNLGFRVKGIGFRLTYWENLLCTLSYHDLLGN